MFVITEQRHVDYEEDEFFVLDKLYADKKSAERAMRKALRQRRSRRRKGGLHR